MIRLLTLILFCFISFNSFAQFSMSNQTVYECYGTLTDSEANSLSAGWYDHNENYAFTICPSNTLSIIIDFTSKIRISIWPGGGERSHPAEIALATAGPAEPGPRLCVGSGVGTSVCAGSRRTHATESSLTQKPPAGEEQMWV